MLTDRKLPFESERVSRGILSPIHNSAAPLVSQAFSSRLFNSCIPGWASRLTQRIAWVTLDSSPVLNRSPTHRRHAVVCRHSHHASTCFSSPPFGCPANRLSSGLNTARPWASSRSAPASACSRLGSPLYERRRPWRKGPSPKTPVTRIVALRASALKPFHPRRQIRLRRLRQQVIVVAHHHPGVKAPAGLFAGLCQRFQPQLPGAIIGVNIAALICPGLQMIDSPGILEANLPSHRPASCAQSAVPPSHVSDFRE